MANFFQDPNPTTDPQYNGGREPERQQADTSLGTLFSGIADMTKNTGAALTTIFGQEIHDDAKKTIDPLKDQYGGNIDPETAKVIAGTGAKGKVRALQMGKSADGTDPDTGPLGFAPSDAASLVAGGIFGPQINSGPGAGQPLRPLPDSAQPVVDQLNRFKMAYESGDLSNTGFSAEVLARTKQLKARWPGFEDEIDSEVSKITGQDSANAIRKQLINDIQYNQMAALAAGGDERKYRDNLDNRKIGASLGYDMEKTPLSILRPAINEELGRQQILTATSQRASVSSPQAEAALSDTIAHIATTSLVAQGNKAQGAAGNYGLADYQQKAQLMSITGASKSDTDQLYNQIDLSEQSARLAARKVAYSPIPGRDDGHTPVALLGPGGDVKYQQMEDAQFKPWTELKALIKTNNFSAVERQTDAMKYRSNLNIQNLFRQFPQAETASAVGIAFKDAPAVVNRYVETLLPDWYAAMKNGLGNALVAGLPSNPAPTPSQALQLYGDKVTKPQSDAEKTLSAQAVAETTKQYGILISPENQNTANATHVAGQFFKDFKYFDNMSNDARLSLFMTMGSPQKTEFIKKLANGGDPSSADVEGQYTNWMKHAAGNIWRQEAADLQGLLTSKAYDIQFNPKSGQFEDKTKYSGSYYGGLPGTGQAPTKVSSSLRSVNNVLTLMKPVVGNDLQSTLSALSLDVNAPKEDPLLTRIGKAIGDKLTDIGNSSTRSAIKQGVADISELEPQQTRGVIKGNLSDHPDISVDHFAIPPGMTPKEYIDELRKRHQL